MLMNSRLVAGIVMVMALFPWSTGAVAQPGAGAGEPAIPSEQIIRAALLRTTLVVADADLSKRFYAQVFGFQDVFDGDISSPVNRELLGLGPGENARFVIMRGAMMVGGLDLPTHAIGLLEITGPGFRAAVPLPEGNGLGAGQAMFAMVTDNMDSVIERLGDWQAPILVGPVIAHEGREIEIVTRDPDGARIHVVQQRPQQ